MTLSELVNKGVKTISTAFPPREAREMVLLYLQSCAGVRRHDHILNPELELPVQVAASAGMAFDRMVSGEPVQYIIGKAHFYGREFNVSPSVLIPRPETELLCRYALEELGVGGGQGRARVLDLCTGSGCIAWTVALESPGVTVDAVDISDDALAVASSQSFAGDTDFAVSPKFFKADVLADIPSWMSRGCYDLILSNPPYVMDSEKALMRSNVLDHEPHLALFVSDEDPLLFYRAVARWAAALLRPGARGIVEINEALGPQTADVFRDMGFTCVEILADLSDRSRFVRFKKPE